MIKQTSKNLELSFPRTRESIPHNWIPAFAGMTGWMPEVLKCITQSVVVLTFIFVLSASNASAQSKKYAPSEVKKDTSTFWIFKDVNAGPYFTGGFSKQNSSVPDGWHSSPRFAYKFGATGDFAINDWFAFGLGLFYDSRDLYLATNNGDSDNIDLNIGYIVIQPSIRIWWLLIGLAFDIPMSGGADEAIAHYAHPDAPIVAYKQNLNAATSDLSTVTELHAALDVPIYHAESGIIHIILSANLPFTKPVQGTSSFDTTGHFSNIGKGPLPTVEAGLSYQFDLLH